MNLIVNSRLQILHLLKGFRPRSLVRCLLPTNLVEFGLQFISSFVPGAPLRTVNLILDGILPLKVHGVSRPFAGK